MKPHRAFARQNAYGYWEGCIEYPSGTVSAVTNAKHTESAALDIAQRMGAGADERWAEKERRHTRLRRNWRLYGSIMPGTVSRRDNSTVLTKSKRAGGKAARLSGAAHCIS